MTALALLLAAQSFDDAVQPHAALGPGGTAVVAMIRGGNIVVAVSADAGKSFGAPVTAIDAGGRASGGMRRGPRVGVDKKGGLVVTAPVCVDPAEFSKKYPVREMLLARSADGGKTWGKPVRVNDVPKKAAEALHWLAVADDGTAHVAWLDHREEDVNCLWYTRVKGDKPEKNRRLTGPVCECCAPGLTLDGKGNPVLVVREGGKGDRGVLLLRSRNGGASFDKALPVHDAETNVDT